MVKSGAASTYRAIFLQITFFLLVPELFYFLPTTNYDVDFEKEKALPVVEHNKLPFNSSNSKRFEILYSGSMIKHAETPPIWTIS